MLHRDICAGKGVGVQQHSSQHQQQQQQQLIGHRIHARVSKDPYFGKSGVRVHDVIQVPADLLLEQLQRH